MADCYSFGYYNLTWSKVKFGRKEVVCFLVLKRGMRDTTIVHNISLAAIMVNIRETMHGTSRSKMNNLF